jgi:hypothetical protein
MRGLSLACCALRRPTNVAGTPAPGICATAHDILTDGDAISGTVNVKENTLYNLYAVISFRGLLPLYTPVVEDNGTSSSACISLVPG